MSLRDTCGPHSTWLRPPHISQALFSSLLANSSVEHCHTDDLMPNVPISSFPPSCVDPKVQGLKVIIDCPQPGSSRATYRHPPLGRWSNAAFHWARKLVFPNRKSGVLPEFRVSHLEIRLPTSVKRYFLLGIPSKLRCQRTSAGVTWHSRTLF